MKLSRVRTFNKIWSELGLTFDEKVAALDELKELEKDPGYMTVLKMFGENQNEIADYGLFQKRKRKI